MTSDIHDYMTAEGDGLDAEAAQWFVRINSGEPDVEEIARWQHWLTADEAHRRAFSRFEDLWQTIGQAELRFGPQYRSDPEASTAEPNRVARAWMLEVAATALLVSVGVGLYSLIQTHSSQLPMSAAVETRTAEERTYALTDGSQIDIGARSRIVADLSGTTRSVTIDSGEAYFEVAHEARPFVVRAGSGTITAVGTAFNVHYIQGRVTVTVVEGEVSIRELADNTVQAPFTVGTPESDVLPASIAVRAGEGIVYGDATTSVKTVDTRVATAWREGHLKFIREPLRYVAADVERYTDIQISIADPTVAELLYTGTVIPEEVEDWLDLLSHAFPVEVQRISKRTVLLKNRIDAAAKQSAVH